MSPKIPLDTATRESNHAVQHGSSAQSTRVDDRDTHYMARAYARAQGLAAPLSIANVNDGAATRSPDAGLNRHSTIGRPPN